MRVQDIKRVHEAGLSILERTGVVFGHPDALALFARHGFAVDGNRVRMAPERVERAIAAVPGSFVMPGRSPRPDLVFGGSLVVAGASGSSYVVEGTELRPGTEDDLRDLVKVMHQSQNLDMLGFALEPQDIPLDRRYRRAMHSLLTLSDKALTVPGFAPQLADAAFTTSEIIWGADWHQAPRILLVSNSVSPLMLARETCDVVMRQAALGQPVCVTPGVMGGTTGPATMAGILALQHAECLAGIVLAQTVREGVPCIYAGMSSITSMITGDVLYGVPQYWAMMCATVDIARHLGLPSRAGGSLTDSHLPDMQAGIESTMGLAAVMRCGVDYVLHGTGTLSSVNAVSREKFIIDDELVGMLRLRHLPIVVDDETLALDVIDAVGPGGTYMTQEHTATHCRDYARRTFFNRRRYDVWRQKGAADLAQAARERFDALVATHRPPELDEITRRQLDQYCLG